MKMTIGILATALLCSSTAVADVTTAISRQAPDKSVSEEIHRHSLQSEYLLLEDAKTTEFGSDFGVEGRLFTLRLPLTRYSYEDAPVAVLSNRVKGSLDRTMGFLGNTAPVNAIQDDIAASLPPFRLTLGSTEGTLGLQLGAIESTLGQGALVSRYMNNPRGGFDLSKMGVVLGARAQSVGGQVLISNILAPGRLAGFHINGRPFQWIYGTYANFEPSSLGNIDWYSLLLSALTIGVTGAVDTQAPSSFLGQAVTGGTVDAVEILRGTAGGLSGEADVGINHDLFSVRAYGNLTGMGRTFQEAGIGPDGRVGSMGQSSLFGGGGAVGARFNVFLELIKLGGSAEYRLAGPNYTPGYFDRYYEGDRIYMDNAGAPKISVRTAARHGYNFQLGAQALKTLGVFVEMSDLRTLDPRLSSNGAQLRLGGILHIFGVVDILGAYVNRNFQDYGRMFVPGDGNTWLGEARLNLGPINLVGRQWRTFGQLPTGGWQARDGQSLMGELVIGIL